MPTLHLRPRFGLVTRTRAPGQELGITQHRPEFLTADHAHSTAFAVDLDVLEVSFGFAGPLA